MAARRHLLSEESSMEQTRRSERECPVKIKHAWALFSQTLFVPLAWVLTGRQNKPRWNWVSKQACEYRHETHKLAPQPDEYARTGMAASALFTIATYSQGRCKETDKTSWAYTSDQGQLSLYHTLIIKTKEYKTWGSKPFVNRSLKEKQ